MNYIIILLLLNCIVSLADNFESEKQTFLKIDPDSFTTVDQLIRQKLESSQESNEAEKIKRFVQQLHLYGTNVKQFCTKALQKKIKKVFIDQSDYTLWKQFQAKRKNFLPKNEALNNNVSTSKYIPTSIKKVYKNIFQEYRLDKPIHLQLSLSKESTFCYIACNDLYIIECPIYAIPFMSFKGIMGAFLHEREHITNQHFLLTISENAYSLSHQLEYYADQFPALCSLENSHAIKQALEEIHHYAACRDTFKEFITSLLYTLPINVAIALIDSKFATNVFLGQTITSMIYLIFTFNKRKSEIRNEEYFTHPSFANRIKALKLIQEMLEYEEELNKSSKLS